MSDFWVLDRDLIPLDEESFERIQKVRAGERQTEHPTISASELTEKDLENLNSAGVVRLTWDNYGLIYFAYQ